MLILLESVYKYIPYIFVFINFTPLIQSAKNKMSGLLQLYTIYYASVVEIVDKILAILFVTSINLTPPYPSAKNRLFGLFELWII